MAVVILRCNCKHSFQDKKYGYGKRLHNILANGVKARCTICETVRDVPGSKVSGGSP